MPKNINGLKGRGGGAGKKFLGVKGVGSSKEFFQFLQ